MDTAGLTLLVTIGGILTTFATILTTLHACGKDIWKCFRTMCGKDDIEETSPMDIEMKPPKINPPQSSSNLRKVSRNSLVRSQREEIFYKVERDLMTLLRNCLELDTKNYVSILSGHVDHYHSNKSEDAALGWGCGCGLRNIQMLSSHLLSQRHEAREVLYGGSGFVPDIASLQRWIELARKKGFGRPTHHDSDRRFDDNGSWIGARDCAALLRYFGLRANVVDFESTSSSHVLTEWVWNYFSDHKKVDDRRVIVSEKGPLYFHTDGHSRTIVGIQATRESNGMQQLHNLLIFEPAINTKSLEESLQKNVGWQQKIKRGSHTLKEPPYQLCYVDPGIARGKDLKNLKTIKSIRPEFSSV
ncbi:hypothetical protein ACJIZ3_003435 [Penstemon smallii]|uniref:UFSP1/2/DUB catalytic domain-containing protein n=1 Tax=Penstemon smallii TaxID=265156 RepID=A0ABD3U982_9LAMI